MFKIKIHKPLRAIDWFNLRDEIDLSPSYQRKSNLWSYEKQVGLIDSMLNDYDIPKFYLADFRSIDSKLNTKRRRYAIIDGRQRFEAIIRFFSGELALSKHTLLWEDKQLSLRGTNYLNLKVEHPRLAAKVEEFEFQVMSVITDDDARIEDMFVRLNFGVPVNGAERRNAMPGPVPEYIRQLVRHPFFTSSIAFNTTRMAEYNVAAKLLLIEWRGEFMDTKARNLDKFALAGNSYKKRDLSAAYKRCVDVLDMLNQLFDVRDKLLSSGGSVPLYYMIVSSHPKERRYFREFLEPFVAKVKKNLEIFRANPEKANPVLSAYYTMARTINDKGSLEGRYKIMSKLLKRHVSRRRTVRR